MAEAIWKFNLGPPLAILGKTEEIKMPANARILDAQMRPDGQLYVWAQVDPAADRETRCFFLTGTGHAAPPREWPHIATVQDGVFVWHVFEQLDA